MTSILDSARRVIELESAAVAGLVSALNADFETAARLMLDCRGRVVTTGMGKAGHVARKIAATLASTGTPAFFMHPADGMHGDLGMIARDDVILALSHRGQTEEVLRLIPYLKHNGAPLIAITSNPDSELARHCDVRLLIDVTQEACPLNLAPTSSTTAMLALGDALALALLEQRGFQPEDYARLHPGGSLGRKLLTKVADLMHTGAENPLVQLDTLLKDAILVMTSTKMAAASVIDADGKLAGFFTDGDLRRYLTRGKPDLNIPMSELLTPNPKTARPNMMAVKALEIMREYKIIELPVVDKQNKVLGLIHLHDITRAGIS